MLDRFSFVWWLGDWGEDCIGGEDRATALSVACPQCSTRGMPVREGYPNSRGTAATAAWYYFSETTRAGCVGSGDCKLARTDGWGVDFWPPNGRANLAGGGDWLGLHGVRILVRVWGLACEGPARVTAFASLGQLRARVWRSSWGAPPAAPFAPPGAATCPPLGHGAQCRSGVAARGRGAGRGRGVSVGCHGTGLCGRFP